MRSCTLAAEVCCVLWALAMRDGGDNDGMRSWYAERQQRPVSREC